MTVCELCSSHDSIGLYRILDAHVLENRVVTMWLCKFCVEDLTQYHGVHLKLIKGIEIEKVKLPIPKT